MLTLAISSRRPGYSVLDHCHGLLIMAGVLTGRRKMLAMIAGFGVLYLLLIWNSRHRSTRNTILTALLAPIMLLGGLVFIGTSTLEPRASGKLLATRRHSLE
ncbi:MAG: hypothetical protein R3F37_06915 [Candidatus Competibacteraceae bacterium]